MPHSSRSAQLLAATYTLELPYTNAQQCYTELQKYPELEAAFRTDLKKTAEKAAPLKQRLEQLEQQRQEALEKYRDSGKSLKTVDNTFNCCVADLIYALFMTVAQAVQESSLANEEKSAALESLQEELAATLYWNETKRNEISIMLYGVAGEIEETA